MTFGQRCRCCGGACFCYDVDVSGVIEGASYCTGVDWLFNNHTWRISSGTVSNYSSIHGVPNQSWATDVYGKSFPSRQNQSSFGNCYDLGNPHEVGFTSVAVTIWCCFDSSSAAYGRAYLVLSHTQNGTHYVFEDTAEDIFTCNDIVNATWTYSSALSTIVSNNVFDASGASLTVTDTGLASGICYPAVKCWECDDWNVIADQVTLTISGATDTCSSTNESYLNGTWVLDRCTSYDTCQWSYTEQTGLSTVSGCCNASLGATPRAYLHLRLRQWWFPVIGSGGGGTDGDNGLILDLIMSSGAYGVCDYEYNDPFVTTNCNVWGYESTNINYDQRFDCDSFTYTLPAQSGYGINGVSSITVSSV